MIPRKRETVCRKQSAPTGQCIGVRHAVGERGIRDYQHGRVQWLPIPDGERHGTRISWGLTAI